MTITGENSENENCVYMLQVSLLVVMEIGLFPLICGWWLDICSLVRRSCSVNSTDSLDTVTYWPVMTNQTGWPWWRRAYKETFNGPTATNGFCRWCWKKKLKVCPYACAYRRRCSMRLWRTGSRVLTLLLGPPCSSTGWSAWSMSFTSPRSFFC